MQDYLKKYLEQVKARLAFHAPQPIVVLADPFCADFLKENLSREERARLRFAAPEEKDDLKLGPNDVLLVATEKQTAGQRLYASLTKDKQNGRIVSLICPARLLRLGPSKWEETGLNYEGMFRLVSLFATTAGRGVYAEFGVFDGHTFTLAYHALKQICDHFYAFDSFAGIVGTRADETTSFHDGQYFCNRATFEAHMALAGADKSRFSVIEGPFQETLRDAPAAHGLSGRVSVAHIDSDVYEAAKLALDYLAPVLAQGALILFDEYDQFGADPDKGERRAVAEWLTENPSFSLELYRTYGVYSRCFVFRRLGG